MKIIGSVRVKKGTKNEVKNSKSFARYSFCAEYILSDSGLAGVRKTQLCDKHELTIMSAIGSLILYRRKKKC